MNADSGELCVGKNGSVLIEERNVDGGEVKNALQIKTTTPHSIASVRFVPAQAD